MDISSSKTRLPPVPQPPPGLPPGQKVPTGPRSRVPVKKLPPGPIKLGNRQIPSVLSPIPLVKMSYEEAVEDILEQTGQFLTKLKSMPTIRTSVVLHDSRGSVVKATDGLLLQSDVSLCYLITWLQVFADNYVAKYYPGNDLVVTSVEIRFHNKKMYTSYPNLEGRLSYDFDDNGVAIACVNWLCGNSAMEQYWEAFRSMMQLGSDDQIKYPIIKVRTVKHLAGDPDRTGLNKSLGGGHIFVVGEEDLDVQQYYNHHGQPFPDSLTQLNKWLTESESQQLPQSNVKQQNPQSESDATRMPPQGKAALARGAGHIGIKEPQHGQKANTSLYSAGTNARIQCAGGPKKINTATVRQLPPQMVSVPIGNYTMNVSVPFRPPINRDPNKNWRKFQRLGGIPQLHNAFPLDHMVYDPKDMPPIPSPPPIMGKSMMASSKYYHQSGHGNNTHTSGAKKDGTYYQVVNDSNNDATSRITRDTEDAYEAAVGFSSDDDKTFFPDRNMKEDARSADINRIPKPLHRHGHRPSQNENAAKSKHNQSCSGPDSKDPAPSSVKADPKALNKTGLPSKKFTSTMNVNAPEFVNKPSTLVGPSLGFMTSSLAGGVSNYTTLPDSGFAPVKKSTPSPFPVRELAPFIAVPGSYTTFLNQYQPRLSGDPNFWAVPIFEAKPFAISHPAVSSSSAPSTHNTIRQNSREQGSQTQANITQSRTIDELTRQVAQQTLGVTIRSEVKGRGRPSLASKGGDKSSTRSKSNNKEGSKGNKGK